MPSLDFHSIIQYAEKHHKSECPCNLHPEDFQSHSPTQKLEPTSTVYHESFLLLGNLLTPQSPIHHRPTAEQWKSIVRNHFLILAHKYHPDKNSTENRDSCHTTMTQLNKSYNEVMQKAHFGEVDSEGNVVMLDGKLYKKVNSCTTTCQHQSSFSIYGYPDDVNQWKSKIKQVWGRNPTPLKSKTKKIGHQFGNENESIFINIFDNGTIHIQGIMALQYTEEVIIPLIHQVLKPSSPATTDKKRFSDLLKKSLALFKKDPQTAPKNPTPLSIQMNGKKTEHTIGTSTTSQRDHSYTSEEGTKLLSHKTSTHPTSDNSNDVNHHTPSLSTDTFKQLTEQLNRALVRIEKLETSTPESKAQLALALNRIDKLELEVISLKTENKQLKEQTGPKFAQLTRQIDQLEHKQPLQQSLPQPKLSDSRTSYADQASKIPHNMAKPDTLPKPAVNTITFDRKKCVVVDNIKDQDSIKSDDNIRRVVGKDKKIIIDRISRSRMGPIFVQLSDPQAVEQVITNWNPHNFGGSTANKSVTPQRTYGVLKGVPLTISDDEIRDNLNHLGYANTEVKRIMKKNNPTRAIKVKFQCKDDLEKAVRENVVIEHLTTRVELLSIQPRVLQCYNCQRFGHIADKCRSPKTCLRCSKPYDERHEECDEDEKCINCQGAHTSVHKQCPKYMNRYKLQQQKIENLFNTNS